MNTIPSRSSRPRRYDIGPEAECQHRGAGLAVAALDELSERLADLIRDLPTLALDYVPEGASNSIAMLTIHMVSAEAEWIARVTGTPIPADLQEPLEPGRQDATGELPPSTNDAARLIVLCRRVRHEITIPALAGLVEIDAVVPDTKRPMTVAGVLMHLVWHWTYHSGQVGLLRRLWGARYQWTFDRTVGTPPPS